MKYDTIPFNHPFMMNIVGPSQSGKTYWVFKLIKHLEEVVTPMPNTILYLHGTEYQDIFDKMKEVEKKKKKEKISKLNLLSVQRPFRVFVKL